MTTPSPEWAENAACRGMDPDIFFPIDDRQPARGKAPRRDVYATARAICDRCEVREDCLDEALAMPWSDDRLGMFGGLDPRQRDPLRAQRNREARRRVS